MNPAKLFRRNNGRTTGVAVVLVASVFGKIASCEQPADQATLQRTRAVLSKHRNLYNGDFGIFFWNAEMLQPEGGPYSAKAIHRFVDLLADNGVDTFVINPNSQVAWYPSRAIPTVLDNYVRNDPRVRPKMGDEKWFTHEMLNPALDLKEAGVDCLTEAVKQCRKRGVSPWVSIRMNDPHLQHDYLRCHLHNDPKYRLPIGYLNYDHREVRDYYFSLIRELVEEYDFEGLELDWMRNPFYFPIPASRQNVEEMISWVSEIRKLTAAKAKQTGRPFPLGMRVPVNYKLLRDRGVDVEAMIRDGLVDYLSLTNFLWSAWTVPYDQLRADLGPDITLYGMIEGGFNLLMTRSEKTGRETCRLISASPPALRANSAGKLALGADGIEQFNFFLGDQVRKTDGLPSLRSEYIALRNIHDLEALRGQAKHYTLFSPGRFKGGQYCYMPELDLTDALPMNLEPGLRKTFRLPMCAEPGDRGLQLTIQVVFEKKDNPPRFKVHFNGKGPTRNSKATREVLFPREPTTHHVATNAAYNFAFNVDEIQEGWNEIALSNIGDSPVMILSVEVGVK